MKRKILQVICDRCGAIHDCAFTKKGETDGGYTTFDCYEPVPDDWESKYIIDKHYDLCPDCLRIISSDAKAARVHLSDIFFNCYITKKLQ